MKLEITNSRVGQTIELQDASAIADATGRLFVRKFREDGSIAACMSTDRPHTIEVLRDKAVIYFREDNQYVFSTDYFRVEHGCGTLKDLALA